MPKTKTIKQGVSPRTLLPRVSRHGKLLTDIYRFRGEEVSRIETKLNPKTGEFETKRRVISPAVDRAMTPEEMAVARTHPRPHASTMQKGLKNDGGSGAGKKKVKS